MNAFEALIGNLFEREGYWVRTSYKVRLTKKEKALIGRKSSPRWELDIIAYKARTNDLRIVECKSYLDSTGVQFRDFNESDSPNAKRYKLFNEPVLREVVISAAVAQLVRSDTCLPSPHVRLGLATGKIKSESDQQALAALFESRGWDLFTRDWIRQRLDGVALDGYENSVASIVAKLTRD